MSNQQQEESKPSRTIHHDAGTAESSLVICGIFLVVVADTQALAVQVMHVEDWDNLSQLGVIYLLKMAGLELLMITFEADYQH